MEVWQESVVLATHIYQITDSFPNREKYGMTSQMRRAVVSVPSNIAEGAARFYAKEFVQFLSIAGGSLSELDTQVEIAANLGYLTPHQKEKVDERIDSISMKLAGLIGKVRRGISNSEKGKVNSE